MHKDVWPVGIGFRQTYFLEVISRLETQGAETLRSRLGRCLSMVKNTSLAS